ncbi:MAG: VapC toxin family PIN domain ribonuclease [Deltaproteobacteria bacterium HGW-Deltaproteobacteria-22]|jgi:predicted nucleic acid-binding protein|nr:MAG: VapC toxin family PIN domain ribonuclease [Deltaproteobacteria bacterium HGW-Deltaproteobacteria-22]
MNVVDSCGWLEYFADGPNASFFAPALEDVEHLLVPSVCVFEVYKKVNAERGMDAALQAVALMRQGAVVDLDFETAIAAATWSREKSLPLADSIVYASARSRNAVVWTQDEHFAGLEHVRYRRK